MAHRILATTTMCQSRRLGTSGHIMLPSFGQAHQPRGKHHHASTSSAHGTTVRTREVNVQRPDIFGGFPSRCPRVLAEHRRRSEVARSFCSSTRSTSKRAVLTLTLHLSANSQDTESVAKSPRSSNHIPSSATAATLLITSSAVDVSTASPGGSPRTARRTREPTPSPMQHSNDQRIAQRSRSLRSP